MRLRRARDGAVPSAVATAPVRALVRSAQAPSCRQATRPSGRTSTAEPGPNPYRGASAAPCTSRPSTSTCSGTPRDGGGRLRPRSAVRAGEQGEAAVEQVECRAVAPRVPDPGVRGALARPRGEVDAQVRRRVRAGDHRRAVRVAQAARQAVGRAALHVERAGGGGEPDGAAFRVVAREQRVPGQAAGRPRELPAQLVAVVDRGVQADPGDGGGPVRGVADEEPGPGAVGRRDLGRQRERLHVEDLGIEVGKPGGGAQRRRPVGGHGRPGSVEPQADVGPAALAHRAQRRGVRLVDEGEDAVRLGQRGAAVGTAPGRRVPRCPGARSRCRARRGRCCACRRPRRRTGRARGCPSRAQREDAVGPDRQGTSGVANRISPPARRTASTRTGSRRSCGQASGSTGLTSRISRGDG